MLNISFTSKYALRGLSYLVRHPGESYIKISKIARAEDIPYNFLSKIFQRLIKAEVLISKQGPQGGVKLSPSAKRMNMKRIINMLGDGRRQDQCVVLGVKVCPFNRRCPVGIYCYKIRDKAWRKLSDFKLERWIKYANN